MTSSNEQTHLNKRSSWLSLLDWCQSTLADDDDDDIDRNKMTTHTQVLILDGGVSTYLESVLANKNQSFAIRELWSSSLLLTKEGMDDIRNCHVAFLKAGANIVSTVTYQCNFGTFSNKIPVIKNKDDMIEMMCSGIRLAKEAIEIMTTSTTTTTSANNDCHPKYVLASTGCYGAALADGSEYRGNYGLTVDQLVEFHRIKEQTLRKEKPDMLAFETIPCVIECQAIMKLLSTSTFQNDGVAIGISFACQNGSQLNGGALLEDALDVVDMMDPNASLVHAIGINCCDSLHVPLLLEILVTHMATTTSRSGGSSSTPPRVIMVYPNSGEQWDAQNETWLEGTGCTTPKEFAKRMMNALKIIEKVWAEKCPVSLPPPKAIIGGCCRTSPETITAVRSYLDVYFESDV